MCYTVGMDRRPLFSPRFARISQFSYGMARWTVWTDNPEVTNWAVRVGTGACYTRKEAENAVLFLAAMYGVGVEDLSSPAHSGAKVYPFHYTLEV